MTHDDKTKGKPDEHGDDQSAQPPKGPTQSVPGNHGAPEEQGDSDRAGRHGRPSDDSDPGHS